MRIADFELLIHELPVRNQSFDIKKSNWKCENQTVLIDRVFRNKDIVTLNRFDLINSSIDIEEFIIKTLMWGYPTKGRGNNIDNLLKPENFEKLSETLRFYKDSEITIETLKKDLQIEGLGLSTLTKFTNFLNTQINGYNAIILDNQIIEAINSGRFEELNPLIGISLNNAPNKYTDYIKLIDQISKTTHSQPEQVELFLFIFGRNLTEIKGEECYDEIADI